jgi:non-ribosomal peptide synthetase component F
VGLFKDYIEWLQQGDVDQARQFWQHYLKGFTGSSLLAGLSSPENQGFAEQQIQLSGRLSQQLRALARQYRLTLNTVMQSAWALLLTGYSGETDIVFGSTISVRPAELPEIEDMVGMSVNTLPVRVKIDPKQPLALWMNQLQEKHVQIQQYGYTSLAQIREWQEIPGDQPLFESFIRFQNYPLDETLWKLDENLQIEDIDGVDWWQYPLGVVVEPGSKLIISITYRKDNFDDRFMSQLLKDLQGLLAAMVTDPEQNLGILAQLVHK